MAAPKIPDEAKRLPGDFFRFGFAACAQMLATCTEKPHGGGVQEAVEKPGCAGREADSSGGGRAQRSLPWPCPHTVPV